MGVSAGRAGCGAPLGSRLAVDGAVRGHHMPSDTRFQKIRKGEGLGFRVQGLGFRVWGPGLGLRVESLGEKKRLGHGAFMWSLAFV